MEINPRFHQTKSKAQISIIIPTFNEEKRIGNLIEYLRKNAPKDAVDITVVDGGSTDNTLAIISEHNASVVNSTKGRAVQMNNGADGSEAEILYFLHADTIPPNSYYYDILDAFKKNIQIGSYRLKLNSNRKALQLMSYLSRYNRIWCRGGDQSLFITNSLFSKLGGYKSDLVIMEEYDLILRAKKITPFLIIPKNIISSARKYEKNSFIRVTLTHVVAFLMFGLKFPSQKIQRVYQQLIRS